MSLVRVRRSHRPVQLLLEFGRITLLDVIPWNSTVDGNGGARVVDYWTGLETPVLHPPGFDGAPVGTARPSGNAVDFVAHDRHQL